MRTARLRPDGRGDRGALGRDRPRRARLRGRAGARAGRERAGRQRGRRRSRRGPAAVDPGLRHRRGPVLDDQDVAQPLHDDLDLGDLVAPEDGEAAISLADAAILVETQLEALEALHAGALADELVGVRVLALRLGARADSLVELAEERLVLGEPALAEVAHVPGPRSAGTTSSNRAPCGSAG